MYDKKQGRMRSDYHVKLTVLGEEVCIIECETINISLNGVLLQTKLDLPIGANCTVDLFLPDTDIELKIDGVVSRQSINGFAITFNEMDLDTFKHLKKIVIYNSKHPQEAIEQCKKKIGFK